MVSSAHTHLSGAEPCISARAVVVLTVWYRLVSHKILLPCFSLTRKNVALTFWPTKPKLTNSRPKSNRKGQKSRKKGHSNHKTFWPCISLTRKNVALMFWLNQKLTNSRPKSDRKGQKIPGKGHNVTTKLYCPASFWREKCCCFNLLTELKEKTEKAKNFRKRPQ